LLISLTHSSQIGNEVIGYPNEDVIIG